jgi:HlyD family secretion protein
LVKPGAIVSIVDPEDLKLYVYVSAAMLGHLRLGQKVPLTTDSDGAEIFEGTITYVAPAGEFTPRNLQTKEERVQQVFGVKLKLNSAGGHLRAGMTVTAHLPGFGKTGLPPAPGAP